MRTVLRVVMRVLIVTLLAVLLLIVLCFVKSAELKMLAGEEGIPIMYCSMDVIKTHPVVNKEKGALGMYIRKGNNELIVINTDYIYDPIILAHALGHKYAIQYEGDRSEEAAWRIAVMLLLCGINK